ncbi:hypothetical protein [Pararhodobacter sp.]|nr:hypothetical protein [Pararhodobacter sp.]
MAKPSRWMQWIVTDSADPQIPLAWTLRATRRLNRTLETAGEPA